MHDQGMATRLDAVRLRIAQAAARAGRDPGSIRLVAVSKLFPHSAVQAAIARGQQDFGENRIQEALDKVEAFRDVARWHWIGHLQRNKINQAVGVFDLIHSLDSLRLLEEMEKRAAKLDVVQDVLLQFNVSGEQSKGGFEPDGADSALDALAAAPHLRARGLMTMAPYSENPEDARPYFRRLRELRGQMALRLPSLVELSMGMSGDFEAAIEEGATIVRVGSAIFGERQYD
jgi:hypothetical protein